MPSVGGKYELIWRARRAASMTSEYFESVVSAGVDAKTAANWVMGDVMTTFNESGGFPVEAARLASLVALVREGVLSHQVAKRVYAELAQRPGALEHV